MRGKVKSSVFNFKQAMVPCDVETWVAVVHLNSDLVGESQDETVVSDSDLYLH